MSKNKIETPEPKTTTGKVLAKARDLIARPYGWTRRQFAGRRRGHILGVDYHAYSTRVDPKNADALCFCAYGAVDMAAVMVAGNAVIARGVLGQVGVGPWFNDSPKTKKRQILAGFDKAIRVAEGSA